MNCGRRVDLPQPVSPWMCVTSGVTAAPRCKNPSPVAPPGVVLGNPARFSRICRRILDSGKAINRRWLHCSLLLRIDTSYGLTKFDLYLDLYLNLHSLISSHISWMLIYVNSQIHLLETSQGTETFKWRKRWLSNLSRNSSMGSCNLRLPNVYCGSTSRKEMNENTPLNRAMNHPSPTSILLLCAMLP